jgi:molybdopterin converting factor subunit 1
VNIKVLFFGQLKDITGLREDRLELGEGAYVETVFEHYANRFPRLRELSKSIVLAQNQQFAAGSSPIAEGDEIAFLPPVSGGSDPAPKELIHGPEGHYFALTRDPIDTESLRKRLLQGQDGALVNFEGVVRNNTKGRSTRYLDYECYEEMALKMMARIGVEIASQHAISRIAIVHRLGRMEIGETSVAVLAFAPHRRPSFEAALEGIDRLKKLVPIWKKEYFEDGEVWVDGEWDDSVVRK